MTATAASAPSQGISGGFRWAQLIIGIICMAMMANLQYGWTFFVGPMAKAHDWEIASIQVAFSLFIAFETWLTPIEGFYRRLDRPARSKNYDSDRRRVCCSRLAYQLQGRHA